MLIISCQCNFVHCSTCIVCVICIQIMYVGIHKVDYIMHSREKNTSESMTNSAISALNYSHHHVSS